MAKSCLNKDCKQINPQSFNHFYEHKNTKDGHFSECIFRTRERQKKYRNTSEAKIKEKARKRTQKYKDREKKYSNYPENNAKKKNRTLLRKYCISLEQYSDILIFQSHKCAICKIDEINSRKERISCRS